VLPVSGSDFIKQSANANDREKDCMPKGSIRYLPEECPCQIRKFVPVQYVGVIATNIWEEHFPE
jgi:hypothetical protein